MSDQAEHEALRLKVEELRRDNERLRAGWPKRRISGCCCTFTDDGETLLSQCQAHIAARDTALEQAAKCAIDNQDCDAWEIAAAIRALKGAKP